MALTRPFPVLRVPDFRLLWLASVPTAFAFHFGLVASGYTAVTLSDSAFAVGVVGASWGMPLLVVPLIGGVAADRFSRRRIMITTQVLLGASSLIIAGLALAGLLEVWHLVALGLAQGTAFAFVTPARIAYAGDAVGRALLPNAVAAYHVVLNLSGIVGPAVAGAVLAVAVIGIHGTYALMSGFYVLAVVLLLRLPERRPASAGAIAASARERLIEGFAYVRSTPPLPRLFGVAAVAMLFGMAYVPLMPLFAERVFAVGASGLGLLLASAGMGAFAGSFAASMITGGAQLRRWLPRVGIGFGVALLAFALAPTFLLALGAVFLVGMIASIFLIVNNSLVISNAEPHLFGRVWSIQQLTWGFGPFGALPLAALADVAGVQVAMAIGGILVAAGVALLTLGGRVAGLSQAVDTHGSVGAPAEGSRPGREHVG